MEDGKSGRPKLDRTPEEAAAAKKAQNRKAKEKTKNVTLSADMVDIIRVLQDELDEVFGFRPTQSQALRYLLEREKRAKRD